MIPTISTRHSPAANFLPVDFMSAMRDRWPHLRSHAEEEPIFVLAAGWRSGSTLLQRMLMHNCFVWGEPYGRAGLLPSLSAPLCALGKEWPPEDVFSSSELEPQQLSKKFIANLFPAPERLLASHVEFFRTLFAPPPSCSLQRWGVKEVRLGADYAFYLRWLFPRAKFLLLVRNPYDCFRSYAALQTVWHRWWPYDPIDSPAKFGEHWLRLAKGFLAHHQPLGGMLLRYEDVTEANFDPRPINDYLGFDLDLGVKNSVVGASPGKVAEPAGLGEFQEIVGQLASEFGYPAPSASERPARGVQKEATAPIEQQFQQLQAFREELLERDETIESLRNALAAAREECEELNSLLKTEQAKLHEMENGRAWKLARLVRRARHWLAP